jgi:hypothetical protein
MSEEVLEPTEEMVIDQTVIPSIKDGYEVMVDNQNLKMFIVDITSEMAKSIVDGTNVKNRILSHKNIRQLQREMESGNWVFAGNPIKFDLRGRMLDGQHRLIALSKTKGLTFKFLIIVGLEENTFKVMDTGKKRSAGDVFSIEGVHYPKITATTVKFIHALENGSFLLGETAMNSGLSNTEAYEKYLALDNVDEFVSKTRVLNTGYPKLLSDPTVAGFWYMFSKINKKDADEFMEKLIQGTNLSIDSPIKHVHDKLFSLAHTDTYKMKRIDKNRLVAMAWKKFRAGETMTKLVIPRSSQGLTLNEL